MTTCRWPGAGVRSKMQWVKRELRGAQTEDLAMFIPFLAALDRRLRARQRIVEYSTSPFCIFRMQVVANDRELVLTDGTIVRVGDRVINLHLWNEQVPPFPAAGPTLGWARRMSFALDRSLRELAAYLTDHPSFDDVTAISATMGFGPLAHSDHVANIAARYGFIRASDAGSKRSLPGRLHQFGENILISMIVISRNPAALRSGTLSRDRVRVFLSRADFIRRFGVNAAGQADRDPARGPESAILHSINPAERS
jgi:hypothetical protein